MNLEEYQPLAMRTAKPMTPLGMLNHGAMGCGSEAGELAISATLYAHGEYDRDNFVEELGDATWFATYMAQALGLNLHALVARLCVPCYVLPHEAPGPDFQKAGTAVLSLCGSASEILTIVKAHKFYGKVLDVAKLEAALVQYVSEIYGVCHTFGIPLSEVLKTNVAKLRKRYAAKYSDVAAIARADKVDEIDPRFPAAHYGNDLHVAAAASALSGNSQEETMERSVGATYAGAGGSFDGGGATGDYSSPSDSGSSDSSASPSSSD